LQKPKWAENSHIGSKIKKIRKSIRKSIRKKIRKKIGKRIRFTEKHG